jgi:tetratricopeptide (TPR) repeat protein
MEVFMKLKFYSLLFIGISSFVLSCKTATKLYEKGHYDEAVELAAKKLQKDPNDIKLMDVLQNAYRYAVEDHENRIRNNTASNNDLKWEWNYNEYADLQRLYEAIRKSPVVFERVNPVDYSSYITTFGEKAGEVRYQRGLTLMSNNDKLSYRNAYREFQAALGFIPGDLGIRQKMEEAYSYAVMNIVVMPVEERSSYQYGSYNYKYRSFDDNILRYLQSNNGNEFIKYYSSFEARNRNIRPDQVVDVRFSSMNIGRSYDDQNTRTVSKDVVVKETVYRPDSIVKEYAKVYAKITTTKRTMRSDGLMQISILDENNSRVWSDNFSGQHFWTTEFSTYTGDSRALNDSDKQLLNHNQEYPPREEDIIRCIMDEIQSKVECGIKDYYNRY